MTGEETEAGPPGPDGAHGAGADPVPGGAARRPQGWEPTRVPAKIVFNRDHWPPF